MKQVVAILVTWNKKDLVLRNLDRVLNKVRVPAGVALDVVVIDNHSDDGTREAIAERFPGVTVIDTGDNRGGSGGFNAGLSHAMEQAYDYVWAMDNDALPSRGLLEKYWAATRLYRDRALLGGTMNVLEEPSVINESGAYLDRYARIVLRLHRMRMGEALRTQPPFREVDYVAFANVFFPIHLLREVGLFPDFFIHYDDVDFSRRASCAGYHVISVLDAVYWHESYQSKPAVLLRPYDIRNQLYVLGKTRPRRVRRSMLNHLIDTAADWLRGRYRLVELTLEGMRACRRGAMGKQDIPQGDFSMAEIRSLAPDQLMRKHGAGHCVLHYTTYARLFRPYRREWHRFMRDAGDQVYFLVRRREGRFRLAAVAVAECESDDLIPIPEVFIGRRAGAAIARDALLLTNDMTLNLRENLFLHRFRKRLWVWGGHVLDYGRRGPVDHLRFAAELAGGLLALFLPFRKRADEAEAEKPKVTQLTVDPRQGSGEVAA